MSALREGDLVWPKYGYSLKNVRAMRITEILGQYAHVQIIRDKSVDYEWFLLSMLIYAGDG